LVSVRSATEAETALSAGADIIDVKEPSRGSLGMANAATIAEVVAMVAGRAPVSAALGDLCDQRVLPPLPGVAWGKLGYLPASWQLAHMSVHWLLAEREVLPTILVPVFYADAERIPGPTKIEPRLRTIESHLARFLSPPRGLARGRGVLVDTAVKDGCGLLQWYSPSRLRELCERCHAAGLFVALAGSLSHEDVELLLAEVRPDIIAVRGAACERGERGAAVSADAVAALKDLIRAGSPA